MPLTRRRALGAAIAAAVLRPQPSHAWRRGSPSFPASFFGQHYLYPLITPHALIVSASNRVWDNYSALTAIDPPSSAWAAIEALEGSYSWSFTDSNLQQMVANDQEIIWPILGEDNAATSPFQPTWAYVSGTTGQVNLTKLAIFVTALCTRIRLNAPKPRRIWIEGRNEVNGSFLTNGGTAQQAFDEHVAIFNAVAAYNLANSDNIQVVSPTCGNNSASAISFMTTMLGLGLGNYCDVVACHSYASSGVNNLTLYGLLRDYAALWRSYGQGNKPFWSTEGFSGVNGAGVPDINDRAANAAKYPFINAACGFSRAIWYGIDAYAVHAFPSFGLLITASDNLTLNVVGIAYQQSRLWALGANLIDYSFTSALCSASLVRPGYQGRVLWAEDRSSWAYTVPSGFTQYRTIDGVVHAGLGATVTLGYTPIILETGNP